MGEAEELRTVHWGRKLRTEGARPRACRSIGLQAVSLRPLPANLATDHRVHADALLLARPLTNSSMPGTMTPALGSESALLDEQLLSLIQPKLRKKPPTIALLKPRVLNVLNIARHA